MRDLGDAVRAEFGLTPEVRVVSLETLVPALFQTARPLQKPQFLFRDDEPWGPNIRY
jgi:hypothetical protein